MFKFASNFNSRNSSFYQLTGITGLLKNQSPFKNERVGVRRQIVSNLKKTFSDPASAVLPT